MKMRFPDEESGTSFVTVRGLDLIRNYGDPEAEYAAASGGAAVRDRGHRAQWRFTGRQPAEMLAGIVTGTMPEALARGALDVLEGRATFHTVLTPKGKIVADLRLWRVDTPEGGELRADVPRLAAAPLQEHLTRFLPPRLARVEDRSESHGTLTVLGPDAARLVSGVVLGLRVEEGELEGMEEGGIRALGAGGGDEILVMKSCQLSVPAFDIVAERGVLRGIWDHLTSAGVVPVGLETWDTLRVEAGRPSYRNELQDDVIPVEAGIHHRVIDYGKGCYTGQEVIVRIRDRGRVNRHLRRLVLDINAPLPAPGTELFREEERPAGRITTAADSPRMGKLALAYLRREVTPGQTVTVGGVEGPRARVESLEDE